ncbi:ankyrin repeat domain-containing protein [Chloroflexota bacterium]
MGDKNDLLNKNGKFSSVLEFNNHLTQIRKFAKSGWKPQTPEERASYLLASYSTLDYTDHTVDQNKITEKIKDMPVADKAVLESIAMDIYSKWGHIECARILAKLKSINALKLILKRYKEREYTSGPYNYDGFDELTKEILVEFGDQAVPDLINYLQKENIERKWAPINALKELGYYSEASRFFEPRFLVLAAARGNIKRVKELLDKAGDLVNREEGDIYSRRPRRTPLCAAAKNHKSDIVKLLLDKGADPNLGEITPLVAAVANNDVEVVKILLEKGANPNLKSREPPTVTTLHSINTPLNLAAKKGYVDMINVLLDHGALVNPHGWSGWSPLHEAAMHGQLETVKVLLRRGAIINPEADSPDAAAGIDIVPQVTPLDCAEKWPKVFEFLLNNGAIRARR